MARFHINNNGDAGTCRAATGACPFGGEADHYETPEEARAAFEREMGGAFQKMSREEVAEIAEALTMRFQQYVALRDDLGRHRAERNREAFDATVRQLRYYEARNWHGVTLKESYPALYQRACRGIAAKRRAEGIQAPVPTPRPQTAPASAPERRRLTVPEMQPLQRPQAPAPAPKAQGLDSRMSGFEEIDAPLRPEPKPSPTARARKKLSQLSNRVRHPYGARKRKEEEAPKRTPKGDSGPNPEFIEALRKMYVAKFGTQPEDDGVDTGTLMAMFNKGELG